MTSPNNSSRNQPGNEIEKTKNQTTGKTTDPDRKIIYHLLMGIGFLGLIGWFYLMRQLEFMVWLSAFGPESHKGAMNMLAVMVWMLPAFFCWKYYVRFINKRLNIGGIYYEDHYYRSEDKADPSPTKDKPENGSH